MSKKELAIYQKNFKKKQKERENELAKLPFTWVQQSKHEHMVITVTPRMQPYCFQRAFCQSSKISPFCIWHVCFFRWLQRGKSIVTNATYESHNLQKDSFFFFFYQTKQQRYLMNDMMCQILHFFFFLGKCQILHFLQMHHSNITYNRFLYPPIRNDNTALSDCITCFKGMWVESWNTSRGHFEENLLSNRASLEWTKKERIWHLDFLESLGMVWIPKR